MPWQLLMLFQNLLAAIFAINSRQIALKFKRAALPLNLMIYAVISISGVAYALVKGFSSVSPSEFYHFVIFFVFAGACFAITNILSYIVFQYVDAAIATLLATLNVITSVVASTLLIHESLTSRQIFGAVIVLLSMYIILGVHANVYRRNRLWAGLFLSIVASIFFGFAAATEKYLLNHVNLSTYLVFGWGFQFVGVITVSVLLGIRLKADFVLLKKASFWKLALPASVIRMASGLLFIFSLKLSNNLSIISVYSGFKVILAALLGVYILRERAYLFRKFEAALLAMLGIAVMLWK